MFKERSALLLLRSNDVESNPGYKLYSENVKMLKKRHKKSKLEMLAKKHFHFSGWSIEINHLFINKNKYNQNSIILISVNPIKAGGS